MLYSNDYNSALNKLRMPQFHLSLFCFLLLSIRVFVQSMDIVYYQDSCQTYINYSILGVSVYNTVCYPLPDGRYINIGCSGSTSEYSYSTHSQSDCSTSDQLTAWQQGPSDHWSCVPSLGIGIICDTFTPRPATIPITYVPTGQDYRLYVLTDYCQIYTTSITGMNGGCVQIGYNTYSKVYCSGASGNLYTIATYSTNQCVSGEEVVPFQQHSGSIACTQPLDVAVQCSTNFLVTAYSNSDCNVVSTDISGFNNGDCFPVSGGNYAIVTCTSTTSAAYSITVYSPISSRACANVVIPLQHYSISSCFPDGNIVVQCIIQPPTTQPPTTPPPTTSLLTTGTFSHTQNDTCSY